MLKLTRKSIILLSVCVVLVVAAALLLYSQKERLVSVLEYLGEVLVNRPTVSEPLPVFEGMRVESGDEVETKEESSVTLQIDSNKVVRVKENTRVTFQELTSGQGLENTIIYLEKGVLVNDIKERLDQSARYTVSTPNSTVSVRGTYFTVQVGQREGYDGLVTVVNVYHGRVAVENSSGEVTILDAEQVNEAPTEGLGAPEQEQEQAQVLVPQGNRAIIGAHLIELRRGVDYEGLDGGDLDRLSEIARTDVIGVTPEALEEQKELLEEPPQEEPPLEELPEEPDKVEGGPDTEVGQTESAPEEPLGEIPPVPPEIELEQPPASSSAPEPASSAAQEQTSGDSESSGGGSTSSSGPVIDEADRYQPGTLTIKNKEQVVQQLRELKDRSQSLKTIQDVLTNEQRAALDRAEQSMTETQKMLDDVDAANSALDLINDLPLPSGVVPTDKDKVSAARGAYDGLTADQKALVPANLLEKLEKCEERLTA